jgi:Asp-tRNA(Asn)/Glu-tRNA(Gln) amidotransferase A subunit family amidase
LCALCLRPQRPIMADYVTLAGTTDGTTAAGGRSCCLRSPESTGDPAFQSRWSLIGWPSISLPSGISSDGLPFAVQLVARRLDEATLLRAARRVEEVLGFSGRPPD